MQKPYEVPFMRSPLNYLLPSPRKKYSLGRVSERYMTIAAGLRCNDGVVLTADSQYTYGDSLKTQGTKLVRVPAKDAVVVLAGAGAWHLMQSVFEGVRDGLDVAPARLPEIKEMFEKEIEDIYRKYGTAGVYDQGGLDMLIAARDVGKKVVLWHVSYAEVLEVHDATTIGAGRDLGAYLLQELVDAPISIEDAAVVAGIIIREASEKIPTCGGDGIIVKIHDDPGEEGNRGNVKQVNPEEIAEIGAAYKKMRRMGSPPILSCLSAWEPDDKLENTLQDFVAKVKELRAILQKERLARRAPGKYQISLSEFGKGG
jgi:20S proteasome alpha/beta subunit